MPTKRVLLKVEKSKGIGARSAACEFLEHRVLLSYGPNIPSAAVAYPTYIAAHPSTTARPFSSSIPPSTATTPAQMRHFYGVDSVNIGGVIGNGQGQTIAIVDVYNDPDAKSDLQHFDSYYGLADPPSFLKYNESGQLIADSGGTANDPTQGSSGNGWQIEESLDIEWAHVIAPAANIALIECNSANDTDLFAGVVAAAKIPNAVCVSMSWGIKEFSGESSSDSTFTSPGLVYLGAAGDNGATQTSYPAASPNVISVGGTTIHFASGTTDGTYGSESGWSDTGGRISLYESKPTYQNSVLSGTKRGTPDVSMDADPNTGVNIYDSFDFGASTPWAQYGGTSLATPMWAALIAIVDQGRAAENQTPLSGRTGALPAIYAAPSSDFHDVTTGSNGNGQSATVGYDTVTGLGTPNSSTLLNAIAGIPQGNRLVFTQPPAATVAGTPIDGSAGVQLTVEDPLGNTVTSDSSTVTLTLNGATFAGGAATSTAPVVDGVATFAALVIDTVGNYTLTATDGMLGSPNSSNFNITPAAANTLVLVTGPSNTTAGVPISPAVTVNLFDQFGNLATTDTSSVTMNVVTGPGPLTGDTTVQASGGTATFSNLLLNQVGTYSIQPTDGAIAGPVSSFFQVTMGAAAKLGFAQQPTDTTTGGLISPTIVVDVEDHGGNLITNVVPTITLTLSSGTFSTGSPTATAVAGNGVAVFNSLAIDSPGAYTITATSNAALSPATSNPFNVTLLDVISATNSITLTQGLDGQDIEWTMGPSTGALPIDDPNGLTINGDGNNDHIDLNYANGNPLPNTMHLNGTFTITDLQGSNPLANTSIEIGQSTVYFAYSPASNPVAAIQAALTAGYNGGAWNGSAGPDGAITSTAAASGPANAFAVGFADSADGVVATQPADTIEVRYTLVGDANLDGVVNSADALQMTRNWNAINSPAWDLGNFNYDATVNVTDAALLQKNWNATLPTAAALAVTPAAPTPAAPALAPPTSPPAPAPLPSPTPSPAPTASALPLPTSTPSGDSDDSDDQSDLQTLIVTHHFPPLSTALHGHRPTGLAPHSPLKSPKPFAS